MSKETLNLAEVDRDFFYNFYNRNERETKESLKKIESRLNEMVEIAISTSKPAFTFVDGEPKMYGGKGADKKEYREWKKKLMEDLNQKKQFFQLAKVAGVFQ